MTLCFLKRRRRRSPSCYRVREFRKQRRTVELGRVFDGKDMDAQVLETNSSRCRNEAVMISGSSSARKKLHSLLTALKDCGRLRDLRLAKELHFQMISCGRCCNKYLASSLINVYAKCGSMVNARIVFDSIVFPDVVVWNALLQGYTENGSNDLVLDLFAEPGCCVPNGRTYAAAVRACASFATELKWLQKGEAVHAAAVKNGCCDKYVETELLKMYAAFGKMTEARSVFDKMIDRRDVVSWTALLQGYVQNGESREALELFDRMGKEGCDDGDCRTYAVALSACAALIFKEDQGKSREWLEKAEEIFSRGVSRGCCEIFAENILIHIYARSGNMVKAVSVFHKMARRDVVTWNALLQGFVDNGENRVALELYEEMGLSRQAPNARSFVAALGACAALAWFVKGREVHARAVAEDCCDIFVENSLIDCYARCGQMGEARSVFDGMMRRDVVSWTGLLRGYVENGDNELALELFDAMESSQDRCVPNDRSFAVAITACGNLAAADRRNEIDDGGRKKNRWLMKLKELHARFVLALEDHCCCDGFLQATVINAYAKCGCMELSRSVFDELRDAGVISWTALLQGYVDNGENEVALKLFADIVSSSPGIANARTYAAALQACACLAAKWKTMKMEVLDDGKAIHKLVNSDSADDVYVQTTLISFYSRCGELLSAQIVFDNIATHNVVTWNCLLQGYVANGENELALELFSAMNVDRDLGSFVTALGACCNVMAIERGEAIHEELKKSGLEKDVSVSTSLVSFYGKCGRMDAAKEMFDSIVKTDVVAWNALLCGYGVKGDARQVLECFKGMKEQGVMPDKASFVIILTACSHGGFAKEGADCFESMQLLHGISPQLQHYGCMVDLMGRANCVEEAVRILRSMLHEADSLFWSYAKSQLSQHHQHL